MTSRTTNSSLSRAAAAFGVLAATAAVLYAAAGNLDATYGTNGVAAIDNGGGFTYGVAALSDGRTLVAGLRATGQTTPAGYAGSQWWIERHTASGALDTTFGTGGAVGLFGVYGSDAAYGGVRLDASGRAVVAGRILVQQVSPKTKKVTGYVYAAVVARLTSGGALDTTFGSGGVTQIQVPNSLGTTGDAMALQPDGRILVAGTTALTLGKPAVNVTCAYVARLNASGSLDTTFGSGGFAVDLRSTNASTVCGVALQAGGQVVVGQRRTDANWSITRLSGLGVIDTSWGAVAPSTDRLRGLAVDRFGRVVATGQRDIANGRLDAVVTRYLSDGTIDASFGSGGTTTMHPYDSQFVTAAPAFQADDAILVPIQLTTVPGSPDYDGAAVARLLDSGAIDTTYGGAGLGAVLTLGSGRAGAGPSTRPCGVAFAPDGDALLGGSFTDATPAANGSYGEWFVARYDVN